MKEQPPHSVPNVPQGSPEAPRERPVPRVRSIDLLLVLLSTAAALFLIGGLIDEPELTTQFVVTMLAIQSAIPMVAVYLIVIRLRGLSWWDLGFRQAPRRWYAGAVLIALLTLPAVALVNLVTQNFIGTPFRNPQLDLLAPAGFTWTGLVAMLVMVGIVAPIVEEVVFRGLLYGWLRFHLGAAVAAVLSALAFGAVHGIPILIPALALTGLVLAVVYERSGSLWPPIIVHATFNMVMTLALYASLAAGVPLD